jgi:adenosylhomocysteine nucleosidase
MGTPGGLKNFPASPEMRAAAISACKEAVPGIGIYEGRIVSGDQFICTAEQKHRLVDTFHALCTEMEGAAIAHTAYLNKIPFVVLRAISDKADEEADVSYETFEHQAAENCARLVSRMVRSLGAAS